MHSFMYYLTAPIRLFGRSRLFRWSVVAVVVLGGSFVAASWVLDQFLPADNGAAALLAKLPPPPPLKAVSSASVVITPVTIPLSAIRDRLDAAAPREFVGKNTNPVSKLLSSADVGITVSRGSMSVSGKSNVLTVAVPLLTKVNLSGKIIGQTADAAGKLTDQIGGLLNGALGQNIGKAVGNLTTQVLNQTSEMRGQVLVHVRPALTANWRVQPNATVQTDLGKGTVSLGGVRVNLASEAQPLIDRAINEQLATLQEKVSNDPFLEKAAREQWAKMCRSIPLGGGKTGLPQLWLEMRPVRAAAAQPQVDGRNVTLTIGVQADTRVTAQETKPTCPFPARLELVPPMEKGKLTVGLPIDVPFTMLNSVLEAQLKGRHFPDDKNAPVDVTVRSVHVAAAGDRLLITLKVHAVEKKSWFGFGANATIHVWGKPALDTKNQILRFADIQLAVESQAAYGLLSAAARAAAPYLKQALAERAVVDLKPFAADARKKIAQTLADFRNTTPGVQVKAAVNDLRLTGIAFDAKTLRITAAAGGTVNVAVMQLPKI
jgi:hypothetical protein